METTEISLGLWLLLNFLNGKNNILLVLNNTISLKKFMFSQNIDPLMLIIMIWVNAGE